MKRTFYCCYNYEYCYGCCRVDNNKKFSKCEKLCPLISFYISSAGIIACSIAALVYIAQLKSDFQLIKCAIAVSYFELMNGASSYTTYGVKWQGFTTIIDETKSNLENFHTKLVNSNLLRDIQSGVYSANCPDVSTVITNLNNLFGSSTSSSSVIANPPRSVDYSLIPSEASNTIGVHEIEFDITATDYILFYKQSILVEYQIMINAIPIICKVLPLLIEGNPLGLAVQALDQFSSFKSTVDSTKTDLLKGMSQFDYIFIIIQIIFSLIFAFHIFLTIISILAILFSTFKQIRCCRCLLNCCWCTFSIVIIIGFLLTTALIGAGVIVQDSCDLISLESLSSSQFKDIIKKIFDKGPQLIDICLNSDGNLGNVLGLNIIKDPMNDL